MVTREDVEHRIAALRAQQAALEEQIHRVEAEAAPFQPGDMVRREGWSSPLTVLGVHFTGLVWMVWVLRGAEYLTLPAEKLERVS